jgi:7,8-dihydropterin-6-yl-methyl-4-(beta-D-ribofuranosyl)aminobenzene 5'-phosphate synthase
VDGLVHNMKVFEADIADVEAIVMSHGHFDHTGGLNGLVKEHGKSRLPMLLHPDFWLHRRLAIPNADPLELPTASRGAIEGAGFEIVEGRRPSLLLEWGVLITGEVDRTTDFEKGFPVHQAKRDGAWTADPLIMDDQALIANVRGHGLLVMTGCGHSGIINIIRHAQRVTGESRIAAVIGGFHLTPPLFSPLIPQTVAALQAIAPAMIVPAHCTGYPAAQAIAAALPAAYVFNSVGTTCVVGA